VLRRIMDFVGEEWDEQMLNYYEQDKQNRSVQFNSPSPGIKKPIYDSAKSRWHHDMDDEDKAVFKEIAGELLIKLGYAENMEW